MINDLVIGGVCYRKTDMWKVRAEGTGDWWPVSSPRECMLLDEVLANKRVVTLASLQKQAGEFGDKILPNRTAFNALVKLMIEELPELIQGGYKEPEEFADAIILLLDVAYLQKIDVQEAIIEKMKRNYLRKWSINPATGLAHHVKGEQCK